jgi:hypothetical protein
MNHMAVQIDRMDTSVEIMSRAASSPITAERRPTGIADPRAQETLREMVGQMMADELDRFMRNRGM